MPRYVYEVEGSPVEVFWTVAELDRREREGRATMDDGRVGIRLYGAQKCSPTIDHASVALACDPDLAREYHAQDLKINPKSAPDHYDSDGRPHWKGSADEVMRRKREYCRERGFRDRNSYD